MNSQTGNKINTIFTNNSTHDTGIQLTGCIVFQQKARGRILRPYAFILPFPPFSPVSTVILCREGKTPRKSALKNQNEIFPKPSPRWGAACCPVAVWARTSLRRDNPQTIERFLRGTGKLVPLFFAIKRGGTLMCRPNT